MKLHDLTESIHMLESFKKDLNTIEKNKKQFFYSPFSGEINNEQIQVFEEIKNWKLIYAFEDSCSYAKELAMVLKNNESYGVVSYYNAGQSVATKMKIYIAKNKEELKSIFEKTFIFNGLDDITHKRIQQRFDFNSIIDNFPEIKQSKPKI